MGMFTKTQNTKRFCKFQVTVTLSLRHEEMRNKIALESRIYCKLFSNLVFLSVPFFYQHLYLEVNLGKRKGDCSNSMHVFLFS